MTNRRPVSVPGKEAIVKKALSLVRDPVGTRARTATVRMTQGSESTPVVMMTGAETTVAEESSSAAEVNKGLKPLLSDMRSSGSDMEGALVATNGSNQGSVFTPDTEQFNATTCETDESSSAAEDNKRLKPLLPDMRSLGSGVEEALEATNGSSQGSVITPDTEQFNATTCKTDESSSAAEETTKARMVKGDEQANGVQANTPKGENKGPEKPGNDPNGAANGMLSNNMTQDTPEALPCGGGGESKVSSDGKGLANLGNDQNRGISESGAQKPSLTAGTDQMAKMDGLATSSKSGTKTPTGGSSEKLDSSSQNGGSDQLCSDTETRFLQSPNNLTSSSASDKEATAIKNTPLTLSCAMSPNTAHTNLGVSGKGKALGGVLSSTLNVSVHRGITCSEKAEGALKKSHPAYPTCPSTVDNETEQAPSVRDPSINAWSIGNDLHDQGGEGVDLAKPNNVETVTAINFKLNGPQGTKGVRRETTGSPVDPSHPPSGSDPGNVSNCNKENAPLEVESPSQEVAIVQPEVCTTERHVGSKTESRSPAKHSPKKLVENSGSTMACYAASRESDLSPSQRAGGDSPTHAETGPTISEISGLNDSNNNLGNLATSYGANNTQDGLPSVCARGETHQGAPEAEKNASKAVEEESGDNLAVVQANGFITGAYQKRPSCVNPEVFLLGRDMMKDERHSTASLEDPAWAKTETVKRLCNHKTRKNQPNYAKTVGLITSKALRAKAGVEFEEVAAKVTDYIRRLAHAARRSADGLCERFDSNDPGVPRLPDFFFLLRMAEIHARRVGETFDFSDYPVIEEPTRPPSPTQPCVNAHGLYGPSKCIESDSARLTYTVLSCCQEGKAEGVNCPQLVCNECRRTIQNCPSCNSTELFGDSYTDDKYRDAGNLFHQASQPGFFNDFCRGYYDEEVNNWEEPDTLKDNAASTPSFRAERLLERASSVEFPLRETGKDDGGYFINILEEIEKPMLDPKDKKGKALREKMDHATVYMLMNTMDHLDREAYQREADHVILIFNILKAVKTPPHQWDRLLRCIADFMIECLEEGSGEGSWRGNGRPQLITLYKEVLEHIIEKRIPIDSKPEDLPLAECFSFPDPNTPCVFSSSHIHRDKNPCISKDNDRFTSIDCCWVTDASGGLLPGEQPNDLAIVCESCRSVKTECPRCGESNHWGEKYKKGSLLIIERGDSLFTRQDNIIRRAMKEGKECYEIERDLIKRSHGKETLKELMSMREGEVVLDEEEPGEEEKEDEAEKEKEPAISAQKLTEETKGGMEEVAPIAKPPNTSQSSWANKASQQASNPNEQKSKSERISGHVSGKKGNCTLVTARGEEGEITYAVQNTKFAATNPPPFATISITPVSPTRMITIDQVEYPAAENARTSTSTIDSSSHHVNGTLMYYRKAQGNKGSAPIMVIRAFNRVGAATHFQLPVNEMDLATNRQIPPKCSITFQTYVSKPKHHNMIRQTALFNVQFDSITNHQREVGFLSEDESHRLLEDHDGFALLGDDPATGPTATQHDAVTLGGARAINLGDLTVIIRERSERMLSNLPQHRGKKLPSTALQRKRATLCKNDEQGLGKILMINGLSNTLKAGEWIQMINKHHEREPSERDGNFNTTALLVKLDPATTKDTVFSLNGMIGDSIFNETHAHSHIKGIKLLEERLGGSHYDVEGKKFVTSDDPVNCRYGLIFFGDRRTREACEMNGMPRVSIARTTKDYSIDYNAPPGLTMVDEDIEATPMSEHRRTILLSFQGTLRISVGNAIKAFLRLNPHAMHWKYHQKANGFDGAMIHPTSDQAANVIRAYFKSKKFTKHVSVMVGEDMYYSKQSTYDLYTSGSFPLDVTNLSKIIPDIKFTHTGNNSIRLTTSEDKGVIIDKLKTYNILASDLQRKGKNPNRRAPPTAFLALVYDGQYSLLGTMPTPPRARSKPDGIVNYHGGARRKSSNKGFYILGLHITTGLEVINKIMDEWGLKEDEKDSARWFHCHLRDTFAIYITSRRPEEYDGKSKHVKCAEVMTRSFVTNSVTGYERCHGNGTVFLDAPLNSLTVPTTVDAAFEKEIPISGSQVVDEVMEKMRETAPKSTEENNQIKILRTERAQSQISFPKVSKGNIWETSGSNTFNNGRGRGPPNSFRKWGNNFQAGGAASLCPIEEASMDSESSMTMTHSAFPPTSPSLQESLVLTGKNQFSLLMQEEELSSKEEDEEEEVRKEEANGVEKGRLKKKGKKNSRKKKDADLRQERHQETRALEEAIKENKRIANRKQRNERMEAKKRLKEKKERETANGSKKTPVQKGDNSEEGEDPPTKRNKNRSKDTSSKDNQSSTQESNARRPKRKEKEDESADESNKDDQKHDDREGGQTQEAEVTQEKPPEDPPPKTSQVEVPTEPSKPSTRETKKVTETVKKGGPLNPTAPTSPGSTDQYAIFKSKLRVAGRDSGSVTKPPVTKNGKKKTTTEKGGEEDSQ